MVLLVKRIAASILSADFARLGEEIRAVEKAGADWIHVDVMDGHFVPNITIGPGVVRAARSQTSLPLDVHLMIEEPQRYLAAFAEAGADYLCVHQETCPHLHAAVQEIRRLGKRPGVAINPATPLESVMPVLPDLDMLLIMSVDPGFGGQKFIPSAMHKIGAARKWMEREGLEFLIEVDGGVKTSNAEEVSAAGADVFVSGSGIFGTPDYRATVAEMRGAIDRGGSRTADQS